MRVSIYKWMLAMDAVLVKKEGPASVNSIQNDIRFCANDDRDASILEGGGRSRDEQSPKNWQRSREKEFSEWKSGWRRSFREIESWRRERSKLMSFL